MSPVQSRVPATVGYPAADIFYLSFFIISLSSNEKMCHEMNKITPIPKKPDD